MSRRIARLIPLAAVLAAVLTLAACGGGPTRPAAATSSASPTPPADTSTSFVPPPTPEETYPTTTVVTTPPPPPPAPTTSAAPAVDPATADRAMCQLTDGTGLFWVSVSSAAWHDYSTCAGARLEADDLDAVFASGPNVDRRCVGMVGQALVGVYSSSSGPDLAAAKSWCQGYGLGND